MGVVGVGVMAAAYRLEIRGSDSARRSLLRPLGGGLVRARAAGFVVLSWSLGCSTYYRCLLHTLHASTSLGRRLVRACAGGEFVGVVEPQAAAAVVVCAVMFGTVGMGHWRGFGVGPGWVDGSRAA